MVLHWSRCFHRKARSVDSFAFLEWTTVKYLLFYVLLSNWDVVLPIEKLAHLALYVGMIRLLNHGHIFGNRTSELASKLFVEFDKDHELFYNDLENFRLHLHSDYSKMYDMHGAFSTVKQTFKIMTFMINAYLNSFNPFFKRFFCTLLPWSSTWNSLWQHVMIVNHRNRSDFPW